MTDKLFAIIWADAQETTDIDAFASDWALSSALLPEDEGRDIDPELVQQLQTLWHVANDPFKDFLQLIGLTQTQCSVRFCIPLRTVQGWANETRQPPRYIRLMIAEAVGALTLRDYGKNPKNRNLPIDK